MLKPYPSGCFSFLLILIAIFGDSAILRGQTLAPEVTSFGVEQFEAHHQIFCAQGMGDGRWAFGTRGEVLIYDGEAFQKVRIGEGRPIFSMDLAPSGFLYVGGTATIGYISPDSSGSPEYHSLKPLIPDTMKDFGSVWNTYVHSNDRVYFNGLSHLFLYDGEKMKRIPSKEKPFYLGSGTKDGMLLQNRGEGLVRIEKDRMKKLPGTEIFKGGNKSLLGVLPFADAPDSLLLLSRYSGAYVYSEERNSLTPFPIEGWIQEERERVSLKNAEIYTAVRMDPSKNPFEASYAIGTSRHGIFLVQKDGNVPYVITRKAGTPTEYTWDLETDERGNLWAGTNDGIALIHTGSPLTIAQEGNSFKGSIQTMTLSPFQEQNTSDALVMGTSQGVWYWDEEDRGIRAIPEAQTFCSDLMAFDDEKGKEELLLASDYTMRVRYDPSRSDPMVLDTISDSQIHRINKFELSKDGRSGFFSAGRTGVYGYQRRKGEWDSLFYKQLPKEVNDLALEELEERSDSMWIWIGFRTHGVARITVDTNFRTIQKRSFDTTDGLPKVPEIDIHKNPQGQGTLFLTDSGLYHFERGRFRPYCALGRPFCRTTEGVDELEVGPDGAVWIDRASNNKAYKVHFEGNTPSRIDSLPFRSLTIGAVRSILPGSTRTWFGGDQGLACYHEKVEKSFEREWNCHIREVRGHRDTLLFGGFYGKAHEAKGPKLIPTRDQASWMVPTLPYGENHLIFEFAAHYPDRHDRVHYSYHLKGYDTAWSKWSKGNKKEYTNLPEGDYEFQVKAKNVYGKESRIASYRFKILPPWYRTWYAYGSYTVLGIAFIYLTMRIYNQRLLAQKMKLERTVEERTKEIQAEKEEVEKQRKEAERQRERAEAQQEETERQKQIVEEAHREITDSINYAQRIQEALLRSENYVTSHLPEHFILFKPQGTVSGDFYWASEKNGKLYIAAVDCTGHGVPGAFMSMLGVSFLNQIVASHEELTPGEVLNKLRERVVNELSGEGPDSGTKDGMDAAMLKIPLEDPNSDPSSKEEGLQVAFAGAQNPLYVVRKGIAEDPPSVGGLAGKDRDRSVQDRLKSFKKSPDGIEIKGDPMPVGYDEYASEDFSTVELEVQKGDMLYLFSDGYADQFGGPKGKKFRYGPFKRSLTEIHEEPADEQKRILDERFEEWKRESAQEQLDDVLVIGIRI